MSINKTTHTNSSTDLKSLTYDELQKKLQETTLKNDILKIADEISRRENLWEDSAIEQIKNSYEKLNRTELKKLLSAHIQEYNHRNKSGINNETNTAKDNKIADLMKQLDDTKKSYNELLDADEKIITPAEYTRRKRLRSIKNKFIKFKSDPKKALAYFLTKTSFIKWGKATASIKRAALTLRSLSSFSTMWTWQISKIKKEIQEAVNNMQPKDNDTTTTKHLKNQIIDEVAKTADKYFEQIAKPINTKINTSFETKKAA